MTDKIILAALLFLLGVSVGAIMEAEDSSPPWEYERMEVRYWNHEYHYDFPTMGKGCVVCGAD